MRIIEYAYGDICPDMPALSAALGFFDGVHLGHRRLIAEAVKDARRLGLCPAVITFPSESRSIKSSSGRLYSTASRLEIFRSLGIELAVMVDFSSVKELSPEEYAEVLLGALNCKRLYLGYNHRFGRGASGNADDLCRLCLGRAECCVMPEERFSGGELSTTKIKQALARADLKSASLMLGEEYFLLGRVERGLGIGKKCGFPTVNNSLPEGCPLPFGVYKTRVRVLGKLYTGLTNVGECPTFGRREPHAETMILDFDSTVYGEEVKISFAEYLRAEMKFSSAKELREQIEKDKRRAKEPSREE